MTFSLEKRTLRKINIDNSVKYISQKEQLQERDIKRNIKKNRSLRKENKTKIFHKNNKKFIKNIAAEGFGILK